MKKQSLKERAMIFLNRREHSAKELTREIVKSRI